MDKKMALIPIVAVVAILVVLSSEKSEKIEPAFHITLASPDLYADGAYTDRFVMEQGEYYFRFVPNGSSPETLSIVMNGEKFDFSEDFKLEGTARQAGPSEYYTWEYAGQKTITIPEMQKVSITINPNGNVMGSVSVDILKT